MPPKTTKEPGEVEQAPRILDLPINTGATGSRMESDSLGEIEVPAEHYWGAQTQRSLIHFSIGDDRIPKAVYHAHGYVKKAAALVMVCIQVIGDDNAVAIAGSRGNFELNAMRPIIINNVLHAARILGDACVKLREYSIEGITLDRSRIEKFVAESLMLVTALSPVIGYDKASAIAHKTLDQNTTLRDAAVNGGFVSAEEFDRIVNPKKMVGNPRRDLGMA